MDKDGPGGPPVSGPPLLDDRQTAELLGVPAGTVRNLHRLGQLLGIVVGRHLRWDRRAVIAYVDRLAGRGGCQDG